MIIPSSLSPLCVKSRLLLLLVTIKLALQNMGRTNKACVHIVIIAQDKITCSLFINVRSHLVKHLFHGKAH